VDVESFKLRFTHKLKDKIIREYAVYKTQQLLAVPSGYYAEVVNLMCEKPVLKDLRFKTTMSEKTLLKFRGELRPGQKRVLDNWYNSKYTSGIIVAKAGFGKTVIASHLIMTYRKPTIILVPTLMILRQWEESIKTFTGITPSIIGSGSFDIGVITVACVKSLLKPEALKRVIKKFSLVIVDEAHTACAPKARHIVNSMYADQKIGLTATPFRKDCTHFHLEGLFGCSTVTADDNGMKATIRRVATEAIFNFTKKVDYIGALAQLSKNKEFAYAVALKVKQDVTRDRRVIILSPRIEHLDLICEYLNNMGIRAGRLVSAQNNTELDANRKLLELMVTGETVLLGTYQLIGTGFDAPVLDCMHLPYSYNNKGLFIQLVGRIERILENKPVPEFVEYIFQYRGFTRSQQLSRNKHYKELGYTITNETF